MKSTRRARNTRRSPSRGAARLSRKCAPDLQTERSVSNFLFVRSLLSPYSSIALRPPRVSGADSRQSSRTGLRLAAEIRRFSGRLERVARGQMIRAWPPTFAKRQQPDSPAPSSSFPPPSVPDLDEAPDTRERATCAHNLTISGCYAPLRRKTHDVRLELRGFKRRVRTQPQRQATWRLRKKTPPRRLETAGRGQRSDRGDCPRLFENCAARRWGPNRRAAVA